MINFEDKNLLIIMNQIYINNFLIMNNTKFENNFEFNLLIYHEKNLIIFL